MSPLKVEDLPPALRKQVDAQLGAKPRTRRQARGSSTGRCHACDWQGTYSRWEAHADAEDHHRFDIEVGS